MRGRESMLKWITGRFSLKLFTVVRCAAHDALVTTTMHNLVAQAHQERQADRGHLEPSVKAVMFLRWIRRARAFTVLVCCLPLLSKADWLNSAVDALLLLFLSTELESRKWTIWRPNICFLFLRSAFRTSAFHQKPCFCMFFYYHIYPRFAVIFKFRTVNNALLCFQISNR
jgi:hypothetical protein